MFFLPYRDENPSYSFPWLTLTLIGVNVYFFIQPTLADTHNHLIWVFGYTPIKTLLQPWTVFTSMLLHANLLHLVSNMWFLWLYGDNIEDRFGRPAFLGIYLIGGLSGNLLHALTGLFMSSVPVIGASGAVAAVMGSYLVRFPTARIRCVFLLFIFPFFIRIRAFWLLGIWMLFEFFSAALPGSSNVAHWAHVGGFAYGFWWTKRKMGQE